MAWGWDAGTVGTNEVGDYWSPSGQTKYIGFKFPTSSGGRAVFGLIAGTGTADIYTSSDNNSWTRVQQNVTLSTTDTTYDSTSQYLLVVNTTDAVWANRHYAMATSGTDAHYSTTVYPGSGASFTWSGPGYTDWDFRSSGTVIKPASLNSSLYDQSQRWRDNITSSNGWNTSYPVTNIFNGTFDGGGGAANNGGGGTITFTPPAAITVTSLELSCYSEVTLTLPDGSTQTISGVGSSNLDVAANIGSGFSFTGSNSITISRTSGFIYLERIKINGKELVDNDVTLASVPSIASTVRANQTSGVSVVTWNGTGSAESVAHSLGAKPEFIFTHKKIR